MRPVISISNLSKTYASGLHALKNVNLEIRNGEIFALLGPNGAGKTTLISVVCGIVTPTRGTVLADGHDIVRDYRAARTKIGLVPQELTTDTFETVWATVSFSRGLFGRPPDPAHLEKVLRALSLWDKRHDRIRTLSGGMKRRVLIAKALAHEPEILFLDEPTAGVDVHSRELFWERIQEQADAGVTVFVTTHFLEEVDYCDRVCFIADGRLVADATPEALRAAHSDGYRIALDEAPSDAALAQLRAAGFELIDPAGLAEAGRGLALRRAALDDAALEALARALGPAAAGRVRVEQPQMNEIFRRLMRERQAPREAAA
jgi:ABC-2 type transport system ATP-binding protein